MLNAPTIHLRDVKVDYQAQIIFDHLNLDFAANKISCLLGASGIGKSTLLRSIAGLLKIRHGSITCSNKVSPQEQIAFMAQSDLLLPWANVLENTLLSYRLRGKISKSQIQRARELLERVGLADAEKKYPKQLSDGMRQRVALARTLIEDKPIVLMDEPFSAVDAITRFQLQNLTAELLTNRTVILVTHDPIEALRLADEIYLISGNPAKIDLVAELKSKTPRALNNREIIEKQAELYHVLTNAIEVLA